MNNKNENNMNKEGKQKHFNPAELEHRKQKL